MSTRIVHVSLNVRSAILWPNRQLKGVFRHPDGCLMTPTEARNALMDELKKGHEVLPCSGPDECEGFDYGGKGCPGHVTESTA